MASMSADRARNVRKRKKGRRKNGRGKGKSSEELITARKEGTQCPQMR